MTGKKITSIILIMLMLLETAGGISALALTKSESLTSVFNSQGLWITEIYQDDIDRSFENNSREAEGYESIGLYPHTEELMEFLEITSTFENAVNLNEMFQLYANDSLFSITDMSGNSNIVLEKGQSVVVWNYRSDLLPEIPKETETDQTTDGEIPSSAEETVETFSQETTETETVATETNATEAPVEITIPSEEEFRKALNIPDTALVLKAESSSDWNAGVFSIKSKIGGKVISTFTVEENLHTADGCSVQLKIPDMGSEMLIHQNMTVPTAGYIYHSQLNGVIDPYVPENPVAGGVFLTEIYPDDIDRSEKFGTDAEVMEWVEITNTTATDVDFNAEYRLVYAKKEGFKKTLDVNEDCVIPAGSTAVFWCRTSADVSLQDFRNVYGIGKEISVFIIDYDGGFDNSQGCFQLYKLEENQLISAYSYNGEVDVTEGFSANLQVSADGPDMLLRKANAEITPGTVKAAQYKYPADDLSSVALIPEYEIPLTVMQGDELRGSFEISATSTLPFTEIITYYRFDSNSQWQICQNTNARADKVYQFIFPANQLFEQDSMELYIKACNRYRNTYLGVYKIDIVQQNQFEGIHTNISNGEEVGGTVSLTANDGGDNQHTEIYLDGVKQDIIPMLEDGGFLFFTASDRDKAYRSTLTTADDEIITPIGKWKTAIKDDQVVHIDNRYFEYNPQSNSYDVTIRFRSGTWGTAFEDYLMPDAMRDEFSVTNLALKLVNGKNFYPYEVITSQGEFSDTDYSAVHQLGTGNAYIDAKFSVPASEVTAVGTNVDTRTLTDGEHTLVATNGTDYTQVYFTVDNKAPVIKPKIENYSTLTGYININPKVKETNVLKEVAVYLDGAQIETPYKTNAYNLGKGQHTLEIYACDMAGNTSEKIVNFSVSYSDLGVKKATATKISHNKAKLNLKIKSGSYADAIFYRAKKVASKNIKAETFQGILPYIQYTIDIGTVANNDEIIVNWDGSASNADEAHAMSMYVLNTAKNSWEKIATADEKGVIDKAVFIAKNHVKNGKATVAVQCTSNTALPDTDTVTNGITANENWDGTTAPEDYDFAFAWETDTQFYAKSYPAQYKNMNRWIVNNAEEKKIKYVIHTGDIVADYDLLYQWETADQAMKIFEKNNMPYGVLGGNHDVASGLADSRIYSEYFGEDRFAAQPYYGGSYKDNLGHYDLISEDGQDFIIVYMSWNVYQEEIDWLNEVLAKYSNRKAILCLHAYINSTGTGTTLLDYFGKIIQREVVAKNPNVFAVLNGHYHGASYETVKFDDDGDGIKERTVYQICTNYQNDPKGGSQYFKMLYFDLDSNRIYMNSYSPSLNDYNYFEDGTADNMNQDGKIATYTESGIMEVEFNTTYRSITANGFSAYISSNKQFGTATADENGKASLNVSGLDENTRYVWYAEIISGDSAKLRTGFYDFTTLKAPALSSYEKSLKAGKVCKLTVKNTNGNKVTYSVQKGDSEYVSVSPDGSVTALKKTLTPATVNVKVGKILLQCKVTVKTNPKLTNRKGKIIRTLKVRKGRKKKILIKGKAPKINNVYTSTKAAVIKGKAGGNSFKVKGKKKGRATVKVIVNGSKMLKLKVKIQ